jgi:hypothetical protein
LKIEEHRQLKYVNLAILNNIRLIFNRKLKLKSTEIDRIKDFLNPTNSQNDTINLRAISNNNNCKRKHLGLFCIYYLSWTTLITRVIVRHIELRIAKAQNDENFPGAGGLIKHEKDVNQRDCWVHEDLLCDCSVKTLCFSNFRLLSVNFFLVALWEKKFTISFRGFLFRKFPQYFAHKIISISLSSSSLISLSKISYHYHQQQ